MKFSIFNLFTLILASKIITNPWSIEKTGAVVGVDQSFYFQKIINNNL